MQAFAKTLLVCARALRARGLCFLSQSKLLQHPDPQKSSNDLAVEKRSSVVTSLSFFCKTRFAPICRSVQQTVDVENHCSCYSNASKTRQRARTQIPISRSRGHFGARGRACARAVTCQHHRGHVRWCAWLVPGLLLLLMNSMAVAISLHSQLVSPERGAPADL